MMCAVPNLIFGGGAPTVGFYACARQPGLRAAACSGKTNVSVSAGHVDVSRLNATDFHAPCPFNFLMDIGQALPLKGLKQKVKAI